ncbi:RGLG3 [Symbiodinium natans]|uniref:RGLG3 protein n=1 Tax=Symbiodinium natans TaxID=878477 RepID=A0A812NN04_9DINO|nr:RGLG3 [Symbiodinium natans]
MGGYLSGGFEASVAAVVKEVLREHSAIVQPSEISNADETFFENQLLAALKKEGMETCNLILGIDFTRSNLTQGKETFHNLSLHALRSPHGPNPYQRSIEIVVKALAPMFDEDGLIPAFIFGDVSTKDRAVRPLVTGKDSIPVDDVLPAYTKAVEQLGAGGRGLSGPTSFAPLIYKAIEVVRQNGNEQHILLILADGAVDDEACCEASRQALVSASECPLSIVMIGVGDGPWDVMKEFDDGLSSRHFDNFQRLS